MRRRTWIKRIRTLSLAMLIASVGLWGVSEFYLLGGNTAGVIIEFTDGAVSFSYFSPRLMYRPKPETWIRATNPDGVDFPGLSFDSVAVDAQGSRFLRTLTIPFWFTGSIALGAIITCTMRLRREQSLPGMCPNCGYDASRCTEGRCSECGQALPQPSPIDSTARGGLKVAVRRLIRALAARGV